jgi:hypothetical protein
MEGSREVLRRNDNARRGKNSKAWRVERRKMAKKKYI